MYRTLPGPKSELSTYDEEGRLVYTGDVADGVPDGRGTLYLPDGQRIVGRFRDSLPVTGSVFSAGGGVVFSGRFANGAPQWKKKGPKRK